MPDGGLPTRGSLAKLEIEAYEDEAFLKRSADSANPMLVPINPETYTESLSVEFTEEQAAGGTGQSNSFNRDKGVSLSLTLLFDGTGAIPESRRRTVAEQIGDLRRLGLKINGRTHTPNFLQLTWGTMVFKGRMKSLRIEYTLFNPDGSPLRAKATADFIGFRDNLDGRAALNRSSPDLTHIVRVMPGDSLPLMCWRVYGDSRHYPEVARVNGLGSFRRLVVGSDLVFPPLTGSDP
jgi:hypothetical protein